MTAAPYPSWVVPLEAEAESHKRWGGEEIDWAKVMGEVEKEDAVLAVIEEAESD